MIISVRRAIASDAPKIAAAERAYIDCPWTEAQVANEIENPDCLFFTAQTEDREFVGYASGVVAADECEVSNIAVLEEYRRRGVGKALFDKLLAEAKKRGVTTVFFLVRVDNEAAIGLYEKLGFAAVGTRRGYYNGQDAAIMRKGLN